MKNSAPLITGGLAILLTLFLNGDIHIPGQSIPPFGKVLHPIQGVWQNGESDGDFSDQVLSHPILKAPVTIIYDERKVPHIFAENIADALFAQGYVEATDRTFQMEFIQRFASGQLAELLGPQLLNLDQSQRRKGLSYAAEKAAEAWKIFGNEYPLIESYVAGVNQVIDGLEPADLPIEFKLIGIEKSSWSIVKSALVFKWMSDVLCGRSQDIGNTNLVDSFGMEFFNSIFTEIPKDVDPVIPTTTVYNFDSLYIPENTGWNIVDFNQQESAMSPPGIGSNNWALSGNKTISGFPIYASDPHLQLTLPSVWYELGIHLPGINSYGVSITGMPGIMMGFNDSIAWGETNVAWDVKDYFTVKWIDKEKGIYELDGNPTQATPRVEEIKIKGEPAILDTVWYTYWGPVQYKNQDLALRWLPLDDSGQPEFMTFINGAMAQNYEQYLQGTSSFIAPAQNFAFASKNGDVALRVNGRFPAKSYQDGRFIKDGSLSKNNWQAYIPRDQNPQVINPPRGFVSSANQRSTDQSYPYYYNGVFEHYRNRTLNELLSNKEQHSIDDVKSYQFNTFSKYAQELLPLLLQEINNVELNENQKKIVSILESWDFFYNSDAEAPALFEIWENNIRRKTADEIGYLNKNKSVSYPPTWRYVEMIRDSPGHALFDLMDTEKVESAADIILASFNELTGAYVEKIENKTPLEWGKHRPFTLNHLARIPAFSESKMELGGVPDALNALGSTYGPSWRMVVELGPNTKAYGVFPGGQSGNPLSKFYKTSLEKWATGDYFELPYITSPDDLKNILYTVKIDPLEK